MSFVSILLVVLYSSVGLAQERVVLQPGCYPSENSLDHEISQIQYDDFGNVSTFDTELFYTTHTTGIRWSFRCEGRECVADRLNSGGVPYIYIVDRDFIQEGFLNRSELYGLFRMSERCPAE